MHYMAIYHATSHSGNEAELMCFSSLLCVSEPCVNLEVFCYTEGGMNEALRAVKRIQCRVAAQIQLAMWLPRNGDNTGG